MNVTEISQGNEYLRMVLSNKKDLVMCGIIMACHN